MLHRIKLLYYNLGYGNNNKLAVQNVHCNTNTTHLSKHNHS